MCITERFFCGVALAIASLASVAGADINTDWDETACDVIAAAKPPTPVGVRIVAIAQTAAYEAVKGATGGDRAGVSAEAAVAAAYRSALIALVPAQSAMIAAAYQRSLGTLSDSATMMWLAKPGIRWRNRMRECDAPINRAAVT